MKCYISHCQTASSMGLLMPGQKMHQQTSNCVLLMPWCDWCRVPRNFSLSDSGMMRVSTQNTSPSSTVSGSWCASRDIVDVGLP